MSAAEQDRRILDAFRDYEAAARLSVWTRRDMPMHTPQKAVTAARGVAHRLLADRLAQLVGVLCIAATVPPDGTSNTEGKG